MKKSFNVAPQESLLPREFYLQAAITVARQLLGMRLVHRSAEGETSGIIVETEAYSGRTDAACHSYLRAAPTPQHRTNIMFAEGGFAYIYLIYGMYNCFNVVVNVADNPEAVLIRALEPTSGIALMEKRRNIFGSPKKLCSGPGKLCQSLGITREHYGVDLCGNELCESLDNPHIKKTLFITAAQKISPTSICATPRINVDYALEARDYPYRFVISENEFLSTRKFLK